MNTSIATTSRNMFNIFLCGVLKHFEERRQIFGFCVRLSGVLCFTVAANLYKVEKEKQDCG